MALFSAALADTSPWFVSGSLEAHEHEIEFTADDGAVLRGTLSVPTGRYVMIMGE